LRAAFPDLQLTVENIIAEGDFVAISLTARGTHQGTFQGIPPTGKSVTVSAFEVVRIENGKLAEHWGGPDTLNLLQQIGAVISAGK
jgi:predicted ester cyclase